MLPALALLLALLVCPAEAAAGVRDGLSLATGRALPALFPFFVAGGLLTRSGAATLLARAAGAPFAHLYRLPPAAVSAVITGLLGGYPVGASTTAALYDCGALSRAEAARVLAFCNCASPGFCVALAGLAVCGSARTGLVLYLLHALSALLVGLAVARPCGSLARTDAPAAPALPRTGFAAALCGAIRDAANTSLTVTAFLVFFSVLLQLLAPVLSRLPEAAAFTGLLELTRGLDALSRAALPRPLLLPLLSLLLGFGGLAVHFQVRAIAEPRGIPLRRFTLGKALHGLLAAGLTALVYRFSPAALAVFAAYDADPPLPPRLLAAVPLCLLTLAVLPYLPAQLVRRRPPQ